jgi:hypothetical protein
MTSSVPDESGVERREWRELERVERVGARRERRKVLDQHSVSQQCCILLFLLCFVETPQTQSNKKSKKKSRSSEQKVEEAVEEAVEVEVEISDALQQEKRVTRKWSRTCHHA